MILDLRTIDDAKRIQEAIIKNEDFTLGEVLPLPFVIKLKGGRFDNYDIEYINADIAKIIVSHQKNYTKLINQLEKKFGLVLDEESKVLNFKLAEGSLEIFSELFNSEAVKNMESRDKLYLFSVIAIVIGLSIGFNDYIKSQELQIKSQAEIKIAELNLADRKDERAKYQDTVNKILEINKDLARNKSIQDAINTPKKTTLEILKDNEKFETMDRENLRHTDINKFEYKEPEVDDLEPEPEFNEYKIKYFDFELEGKPFKIKGITPLVNSSILSFPDRMKLIEKAANGEDVILKIKFILDGVTEKVKEAYILEYKEN